jgi:hypothetical protein
MKILPVFCDINDFCQLFETLRKSDCSLRIITTATALDVLPL